MALKGKNGAYHSPLLFRLVVLQIGVAFLTTANIVANVHQDTPFVVASKGTFYDLFFDQNDITRKGNRGFLYGIDDCIKSVNNSIESYYNLPRTALEAYDVTSKPITLEVKSFDEVPRVKDKYKDGTTFAQHATYETDSKVYNITGRGVQWLELVGVNTEKEKHRFFNTLVQMELVFDVRTLHREMDHFQLFDFELSVLYNLASRGGRIEMLVNVRGTHVHLGSWHWEVFTAAAVVALCIASQLMVLRNLRGGGGSDGDVVVPRLTMSRQFVLAMTAGNTANVLGAMLDFLQYTGAPSAGRDIARAVGGVGCFLAWTTLIQHFERLPPYDTAWIAVRKGLPVVTRFAVGGAPLLLGFACLGMALFSEVTDKFSSLENSLMTLFSVMNGDVILETSRELHKGALGDIYLVCFVAVFIFVIMSVFISIIQDAYIQAKAATGGAGVVALSRRRHSAFSARPPGVLARLGSDENIGSAAALAARLSDHMGEMRAMMVEAESLQVALLEAIAGEDKSGSGGSGTSGGSGGGGSDDDGEVRVVVSTAAEAGQLHYRKK